MTPALSMVDAGKDFPARRGLLRIARPAVRAVDSISISFAPGEMCALVGQNGAGKSTLLRLAAALLTPSRGWVEVCGVPTADRSRARACVGLADGTGLHPRLSAIENLRLAAALYGVENAEPRIREVAATLGVDALLAARVQTLSTGERARVSVARALLHRPRLLLVDEVFGSLDPGAAFRLCEHLASAASRDGLCALVATHDLGLASRLPRVVVAAAGRVVADGSFAVALGAIRSVFGVAHA